MENVGNYVFISEGQLDCVMGVIIIRVGFLPARKVFFPFPWEEMGFYQEETLSSGKKWNKLGRNSQTIQ